MSYYLILTKHVDRVFCKLAKREKKRLEIAWKKIREIINNPERFKPLRGEQFGSWRVHIDSSFVLTYEIDEANKTVRILDFDHHDKIYKK